MLFVTMEGKPQMSLSAIAKNQLRLFFWLLLLLSTFHTPACPWFGLFHQIEMNICAKLFLSLA